MFAIIGFLTVHRLPATVPSCTGARHASILGAVVPVPAPLTAAGTDAAAADAPHRPHAAPPVTDAALLSIRGLRVGLQRREGDRRADPRRQPRRLARREARHRRRERLGQDAHDAVGAEAPTRRSSRSSAARSTSRGEDLLRVQRRAAATGARRRGGDGVPGSDELAQPAAAGRVADRGDPARARCRGVAGRRPHARGARPGRPPRSWPRRELVSRTSSPAGCCSG